MNERQPESGRKNSNSKTCDKYMTPQEAEATNKTNYKSHGYIQI